MDENDTQQLHVLLMAIFYQNKNYMSRSKYEKISRLY
nr:MAG TPA: hypothetical protein [Caudoviricetes sp.]